MAPKHAFLTRRHFIFTSAALASGLALPKSLAYGSQTASVKARGLSPREKLNIGMIGCGGKAEENLNGVGGENIVALCDVDEVRGAEAFKKYPRAKRYQDFRKMLEEEKSLDAVVVTTPDHIHAPAAVMAMKLGKHVYCEKPLTHSIHEARVMRETAARFKVATQMGNQGHSYESTRQVVELVQAGVLGPVREVHVWTDRPIWPQGMGRPSETPPAPATLNWDLWLGPAPARPYHPSYLPFNWRGWWDFGTGALGDMACHNCDAAFWALQLGAPSEIEPESSGVNAETAPKWSILRYQFPARGDLPPVKLTWYDGGKLPSRDLAHGLELPKNGTLMIGEKGTLFMRDWNANNFLLLPQEKFAGLKAPNPTLPRSPGHYKEWIAACKSGRPAMSNFDYATVLTEAVLLGNVALRVGKKIEWDAKRAKARNCPEADQFIHPPYRRGWKL